VGQGWDHETPASAAGDQELARIAPALVENGRGLAPKERGAPGAEAFVAAIGQLIGPAIEGAVAAFHRLDAQGIAGAEGSDLDRAEQGTEVVAEAEIEPQALSLGFEVVAGAELEEACQGDMDLG
jgi:hypothetical protein